MWRPCSDLSALNLEEDKPSHRHTHRMLSVDVIDERSPTQLARR